DGLKPGDIDRAAPEQQIHTAVRIVGGPKSDGISLLLITGPIQCEWHNEKYEPDNRAPLVTVQRWFIGMRCFVLVQLVFGQRGKAKQINRKRDQHTDTRGGKAVMPSDFLAQCSADQR